MSTIHSQLAACLSEWEKHHSDSVKLDTAYRQSERKNSNADDRAEWKRVLAEQSVSLSELRTLDLHSLEILGKVFDSDSSVVKDWSVYKPDRDLMPDSHVKVTAHKVAALKLALKTVSGSPGNLTVHNAQSTADGYDVALSFAGEQREYVDRVARLLQSKSVSVFYDGFEEANLWGKNLYDHLAEIYGKRARFTVIFCSKDYAEKLWTNHERKSAQERAFSENSEYILPARFDDTEIPGLQTTIGYVNLRTKTPEQLCALIIDKIGKTEGANEDVAQNGKESRVDSLSAEARELLELIEQEEQVESRGLVEIMKGVEPNQTLFFPKLVYSGSPMAMKSRLFRSAITQLIDHDLLYPAEYIEMTDTNTYEYRD